MVYFSYVLDPLFIRCSSSSSLPLVIVAVGYFAAQFVCDFSEASYPLGPLLLSVWCLISRQPPRT